MGEKDSIILADFVNSTGNPVFDTTLKQALAKLRRKDLASMLVYSPSAGEDDHRRAMADWLATVPQAANSGDVYARMLTKRHEL